MRIAFKKTTFFLCAISMALLLCFSLPGCSQGSSQTSSGSSTEKQSDDQSQSKSNQNSSQPESQPAQTSKTTYFQETAIGNNNVVGFVVSKQGDKLTGMKVILGYVKVEGNTTTKKNYSISTATFSEENPAAFKASFGSGTGTIEGMVDSSGLTGTITVTNTGSFPVKAPVATVKTCTSCNGLGTDSTSSANRSLSKSCSKCNGVGVLIAYKGTYI